MPAFNQVYDTHAPRYAFEAFLCNCFDTAPSYISAGENYPIEVASKSYYDTIPEIKMYLFGAVSVMAFRFKNNPQEQKDKIKELSDRIVNACDYEELSQICLDGLELYEEL